MRVLVTTDAVGGVWTYTRELVTGLLRSDVDVTLVSFGALPTVAQTAWLDARVDFRPTEFRLEWMQDAQRDIEESCRYLESVIAETSPDLLHLNQYCYGALRSDVPRIVVAHSDVVSWWTAVKDDDAPPSPWFQWYRSVVQHGLSGATFVVAPSQWMLDALRRHYRVPAGATVIYNGRNPELFTPQQPKEALTVGVGRLWDEAKQVSLLAGLGDEFRVVIAGATACPESGKDATRRATAGIAFEEARSEQQVADLFARAAIYAGTSRYEPFGLAPLEAALSRCALVLNDIGSFREIWGDSAVYFRRNDPISLAGCIRRLQAAPALRRRCAERARQRALRRFSSERMVQKYLQLYSSVAAEVVA
jgi:glycogen synthase